jgi:predicted branched-subunit amino acid permease
LRPVFKGLPRSPAHASREAGGPPVKIGTLQGGRAPPPSATEHPPLNRSPHFFSGVRACLPVLPGVAAFGAISGVAMVGAGLSPWLAVLMSVVVFAGTAQLAALQLLAAGAPLGVIFLAGLILNLRFMLYSLSISPHLQDLRPRARWLAGYFLSDNGYAHTIARIASQPTAPGHAEYFMGACAAIWVTWETATMAGIVVGAGIPATWSLEFVVILTFTALAVASIRDGAAAAAALAAGATAIVAVDLPFRLGLIAAAIAGIAAGVIADRWTR